MSTLSKRPNKSFQQTLTLLSLLGLVSYGRDDVLYGLVACALPWTLWWVIRRWTACASGVVVQGLLLDGPQVNFRVITNKHCASGVVVQGLLLGLSLLWPLLRGEKLGVLGAMGVFFCILWAWHGTGSRLCRALALVLALGLGGNLCVESPWALGLLGLILLAEALDRKLRGGQHCSQKFWIWLSAGLFGMSLVLADPSQVNMAQLALLWALVWLTVQEIGQVSSQAPRVQGIALSTITASVSLVFASGSLLMGMSGQGWFAMMWVLLMQRPHFYPAKKAPQPTKPAPNLNPLGLKGN